MTRSNRFRFLNDFVWLVEARSGASCRPFEVRESLKINSLCLNDKW